MPNPPAESGAGRPFSRVLLRIANLVWWLVLVVLVLLALYAGIGRQLTQNIDSHRQDIEQILSRELGRPVAIESLQASWQWLDPVLQASGLRVHHQDDPDRIIAELQHLRIRLDSLSSLLRLRIVFREFVADGLDLTVTRSESGTVGVGGLKVMERAETANWFERAGRLLSDPYVRLTRINLGLNMPGEPTRHVDIPQLDLIYERGVFTATGRAMRSGTTEQIASFSLQGQHFFRGGFDGQLYLDLDSGRLFDGLVRGLSWQGLDLQAFDLKGQGWLTFRGGELVQGTGRVRLPYLLLATEHQTLAPVEGLSARVGWRQGQGQGGSGGEIHLRNLRWRWNGVGLPPFDLRLSREAGQDLVIADGVSVAPLRRLADALQLLPESAGRALAGYSPAGQLNGLRLVLPHDDLSAFEISTSLQNVEVAAYGGAPSASGVSGRLWARADTGWVEVDSGGVNLGFPELFLSSWPLNRLQARVNWLIEDPVIRVFSDDIRMDYQTNTEFTGAFDLKLVSGGDDTLGLQVQLRNGDAGMLADFVPAKVVSEELYSWLTTAVESAAIPEGEFYGHGSISANAPENSFSTAMRYRFQDATVRYDADWPEVTGAVGTVLVHDAAARVELEQGESRGIDLAGATVEVNSGPVVSVAAETALTGATAQQWLTGTPLQAMTGDLGSALAFAGDYRLGLDLAIPLSEGGEVSVDARLATDGGSVRFADAGLAWQQIAGELRYRSDQGFSQEPLTARFLDQPVSVRFARPDSGKGIRITQRGRLTVADLFNGFDIGLGPDPGLRGAFNYHADLDLAPDEAILLAVESSLQGVAVDWPEPLAKPADAAAPLKLWVEWQNNEILLSGNWQQRLGARMQWLQGELQRGELALGSGSASLPKAEGLRIVGELARLDVSTWQQRLETALVTADTRVTEQPGSWLSGVDLQADILTVAGETFEAIQVTATPRAGQWDLALESDQIAGEIIIPEADSEPVIVRLQELVLDEAEETEAGPEGGNRFQSWQVAQWPPVDVRIDSLKRGERVLGAWSFQLQPSADALRVADLQGQMNDLTFDGELNWRAGGAGQARTQLTGELSGGSLEGLSGVFSGQVPFRNANSEVILDLAWPGSPDQVSAGAMDGQISMRFDDGVILESNNTAQLFRVFNLLNSDTLWRRLRLDFSDLYEAGVSFDAISGKALLDNGVLTWDPELQIVGPSGAFKLSGSSDLQRETLDMRLVVVLPLTQNLPLAALLMGASAPIGGALFVLDKVLGDPLSKLTSATYSVGGTWDNPEVSLRNVFDTGQ
ncbi:MAG: YhdP family protein [Marinobacter sp.]|uniref:YhdP family protein n=1 Tax=Marinobacter sp. TaxID=50741 RepID=UPI00299DFCAA|nr:YhdP family protein [Marinobacter sp.]MDX1633870.1 YhdP family protein [Marinobacter sp.]